MSAVTLNHGTTSRFAGLKVATGHALVELPVIIALFYGIQIITKITDITTYVTLAGGIVLFILATLTLKSLKNESNVYTHSPLIDGIVLSAFNPYFYIWWLTIGLTLIQKATNMGNLGLPMLSVLHLSCDYIWLLVLSSLSFAGASFLGNKFTKAVGIVTVIMLYAFGLFFVYDALRRTYII